MARKGDKGDRIDKKSPFEILTGKEIVIQMLRGTIIEGTYAGEFQNYFILTDAKITGSAHIAETPLVIVQNGQVSHLHLKGNVEKK